MIPVFSWRLIVLLLTPACLAYSETDINPSGFPFCAIFAFLRGQRPGA